MDIGFGQALLVVGLLISIAAALSGVMHGTMLSISVLAVAAGIGLAATDVIAVEPQGPGLIELVELALILTLFADGLVVERELLALHWRPPARAIAIAMPLNLLLLAGMAKLLFAEFSWAEALLLGAVLSPTDPVVTSSVVSSRRVPEIVRHTLNLESGLNDGLALPFVLVFLAIVTGSDADQEAISVIGESIGGAVIGAGLGFGAGKLLPALPGGGITHRYEGLYALGLGLIAFAAAELTIGNGLIAAFVAGVAIAAAARELPEVFIGFSENVSAIFQVLTFFVFGALIVATGYTGSVPALAAFIVFAIFVARPGTVWVAFLRSNLARPQRAFIAWFGPKGVASMLFALFVLNSQAPDRSLAFDVAAFVILTSIVAHGLTDTVGSRWIERRVSEETATPRRR